MKILLIIGTRPELIKIAPIAIQLNKLGLRDKYIILNTAQHKDLLNPYWEAFKIYPDYELDAMVPGQNLSSLTARLLSQLQIFYDNLDDKPSAILAQGDTTSVMASSIVSFYNKVPFFHLEAGLRSFDFNNPFPEEFNRKVASVSSFWHFAPTEDAKKNLLAEGITEEIIEVTGNTVVDALQYITNSDGFGHTFRDENLKSKAVNNTKIVLITCHRRENHGENLLQIIEAVFTLAIDNPDLLFVWPVHPNPNVQSTLSNSKIHNIKNILLTPPIDYWDMLKVMSQCKVILTDSGGIQEEAPSFNVPVIVMRETTERPEGTLTGHSVLVGANTQKIIDAFNHYYHRPNKNMGNNPYGDGQASIRIINTLISKSGTS